MIKSTNLFFLLALFIAGCGGSDGGEGSDSGTDDGTKQTGVKIDHSKFSGSCMVSSSSGTPLQCLDYYATRIGMTVEQWTTDRKNYCANVDAESTWSSVWHDEKCSAYRTDAINPCGAGSKKIGPESVSWTFDNSSSEASFGTDTCGDPRGIPVANP